MHKYLLLLILFGTNPLLGQEFPPNDSLFLRQWHLKNTGQSGGNSGSDIGIQQAWRITKGGTTLNGDTIVICLIDNGISTGHPDLAANIWKNHIEIPDNQVDDDQNGYIDDHAGWNAYHQNDEIEGGKHGTPLAGIMAAKGNNAIGISGVNWDAKIMVVVGGFLNEATVVKSYRYPLAMRRLYNRSFGKKGAFVPVINASWGRRNLRAYQFPNWCNIYDSLGNVGILSVASVVNDRLDIDKQGDMPASCPSPFLITVTNSDHQDSRVRYSGYGKHTVDLAAPGENVYTLKGSQGYGLTGGASASAPQVSGAIALLYSAPLPGLMKLQAENPAMAALQVKDWIMRGVDSLPQFEAVTVSGGRLNVGKAIQLALMEDSCLSCPPPLGLEVERGEADMYMLTWYTHEADSIYLTLQHEGSTIRVRFPQNQSFYELPLPPETECNIHLQAFCKGRRSRISKFLINTKEF